MKSLDLEVELSSGSQAKPGTSALIDDVNTPFTVGTSESSDLMINSKSVSETHVRIEVERNVVHGDNFFVQSESRSGLTLLNGIALDYKNKHKLLNGDRIYLTKPDVETGGYMEPEVLVVNGRRSLRDRYSSTRSGIPEQYVETSADIYAWAVPFPELQINLTTDKILLRGQSPDRWHLGGAKNLTAQEYRLLKTLYEHQDRPHSKVEVAELLGIEDRPESSANVFGANGKQLKNAAQLWDHKVRDRISLIRRKIERERGNPLILQTSFDSYKIPKIHRF